MKNLTCGKAAMKVIEGKYVEGGPACKYNDARSKVYCVEGKLYSCGQYISETCHACYGTGLLPVELWPDKVKADWLKKNAPHVVRGDKHCPDELEISVIVGEYEFEWEVYYRDGLDIDDKRWLMASDKDFAIALTKAVIKRAEELCG